MDLEESVELGACSQDRSYDHREDFVDGYYDSQMDSSLLAEQMRLNFADNEIKETEEFIKSN